VPGKQDEQGNGISWQEYAAILANCAPVSTATVDEQGYAIINLPPGDYVIISHFDSTATRFADQYIGVSASDLACGSSMRKHLQLMVDAEGNKKPGKTTRLNRIGAPHHRARVRPLGRDDAALSFRVRDRGVLGRRDVRDAA